MLRVRNVNTEPASRNCCLIFTDCNSPPFFKHFDFDAPCRGRRVEKYSYLEKISFCVSDDAELFDSYRRHRFEPNRLPYSSGAVVIDAFRYAGVRLLAARLLRILTVLDTQSQAVLAR